MPHYNGARPTHSEKEILKKWVLFYRGELRNPPPRPFWMSDEEVQKIQREAAEVAKCTT